MSQLRQDFVKEVFRFNAYFRLWNDLFMTKPNRTFFVKEISGRPSQEINKRVVWDSMLLFRVWTYIILRSHAKMQGQISKTERDFEIRKSLELKILTEIVRDSQR